MRTPLVYIIALLLTFSCDTDRNIAPDYHNYFVKYFGVEGDQEAVDLYLDTDDETLMILGSSVTNVNSSERRRIYLAKADFEGKMIWQKILGDSLENPKDIEKGTDGNYVILSNPFKLSGGTDHTIKLIRVTTGGTVIDSVLSDRDTITNKWSNLLGNSVTPISDGSYMVTGYTTDTQYDSTANIPPGGTDFQDIIAFRFNSDLTTNVLYDKSLGGQTKGEGIKIFEKDLNHFYLMGYSDNTDDATKANINFYFTTIVDTLAGVGFFGSFTSGADTYDERAAYAFQAPAILNQVYFVVGTQSDGNSADIYFTKLFRNISIKTDVQHFEGTGRLGFSGIDLQGIAAAASTSSPPGFLITAHQTKNNESKDIWLAKIDQDGNPLWTQTFGYVGNDDLASSVVELPDGRIILLGTIFLNSQQKISLIKLNSNGQLSN